MSLGDPLQQRVIRIPSRTRAGDVIRVPGHGAKIILHVEAGAQAVVVVGVSSVMEVVLDEGARLELLRIVNPAEGIVHESVLQVRQARDSFFASFFFTQGGLNVRDVLNVALEGEGAQAFLNGLHLLSKDHQAHSHTYVDHMAPSTTSNQLYKSIVRDKAHSFFHGKIMVRREAQLTNSYQLNKNLLLSPDARVDTKPQLEIFADDVKCSHGASIGQLDDDELFYFQTRGIDRMAASEMLIHGFIEDVLDQIKHPSLRAEVKGLL